MIAQKNRLIINGVFWRISSGHREMTIANKEETIYELMESTGAQVCPYTRHHLRSSAQCMWQQ
jgi:hypothetical protein